VTKLVIVGIAAAEFVICYGMLTVADLLLCALVFILGAMLLVIVDRNI